jgi:hypothetical protein
LLFTQAWKIPRVSFWWQARQSPIFSSAHTGEEIKRKKRMEERDAFLNTDPSFDDQTAIAIRKIDFIGGLFLFSLEEFP